MTPGTDPTPFRSRGLRTRLAERLTERRSEIEQATMARVYSISDPTEVEDPAYAAGLGEAVKAGIDYGLLALEGPSTSEPGPVPVALLFQARYAARSGVSLDTVLRRYFAGYAVLGDFILAVAREEDTIAATELQRALRSEAALFDRLLAVVAEEYHREAGKGARTVDERRASRVRMLLAGELLGRPELDYELEGRWHSGAVAIGPGSRAAIRDLAVALDRRLLSVCAGEGTLWAWLGGRQPIASRDALRAADPIWPEDGALAIGEPARGIEGWRLTHRQAKAALPVARRGRKRCVAYADVALFAAALNDEVLASSLRDTFLTPLECEGGDLLRQTLHTYLAAGRNGSSTAAKLGVSRQTVSMRLRSVEARIGRSLDDCAAELMTALELRDGVA